jgi:predicted regulator of Ras-like GTPase activity (Roadblock/LC7/MglB family)
VLASPPVDPEHAIADLLEISSQVEAAVLVGPGGEALAASVPPERAARLAGAAARLLEAASVAAGGSAPAQLEAATRTGSVFVVRDGGRTLAATTEPGPTAGLVLYDLRTCLRQLADGTPEPAPKKTRSRTTKSDVDASA